MNVTQYSVSKGISRYAGCQVCAGNHDTERCSIFDNIIHVKDIKVPPKAILTIPNNLKIESLTDGSKTVTAIKKFPIGTQFGPYQAKHLYSENGFAAFPLKIFSDDETISDFYLNTTDEDHCNWMCYVAPAQNIEEQNLWCYQLNLDIYFSVTRNINEGEQLKVWYAPFYALKIGARSFLPTSIISARNYLNDTEKIRIIAEKLPPTKLGASNKPKWYCKMCDCIETNIVIFAKHLQSHYRNMINNFYNCNICDQGFPSEKFLMKHKKRIHIVATNSNIKEVRQENYINKPNTVQKTDIDPCIPIQIENIISDSLTGSGHIDNTNLLMLDHLNLTNSVLYNDLNDADTLRAILCDDNTKASKTAQEKSIADFSLEFVETGDSPIKSQQPSFTCDICTKDFQNLHYLYRHIKKHTGEFTCVQCLAVFTRKENFMRHSCLQVDPKFTCTLCKKRFLQKKYLKRHMSRHLRKYICMNCGNHYATLIEKNQHNCSSIPINQKIIFPCNICNLKFFREAYLKKHINNNHKNITKEKLLHSTSDKTAICEICANEFKNITSLKQHMVQHADPKFECTICSKKFYRMDVYSNHILSHGHAQIPCNICGKKLKTKKNLAVHMLLHTGEKRFSCNCCGQKFLQRSNMMRHQLIHTQNNSIDCNNCNMKFRTESCLKKHQNLIHASNETVQNSYKCSLCDKKFQKNYLLTKHINHQHNDKMYECNYCSLTFKHRNSIRRHLLRIHPEKKS